MIVSTRRAHTSHTSLRVTATISAAYSPLDLGSLPSQALSRAKARRPAPPNASHEARPLSSSSSNDAGNAPLSHPRSSPPIGRLTGLAELLGFRMPGDMPPLAAVGRSVHC